MVTPLEERAASVVTGKQPILGWRQPLGAAVKSGELRDSITRGPSRSWVRMMRCPLSMSPIEPKIWRPRRLLPSSQSGPRLKDACEVRNAQCLAVAAHMPLSWKTLLEEQG